MNLFSSWLCVCLGLGLSIWLWARARNKRQDALRPGERSHPGRNRIGARPRASPRVRPYQSSDATPEPALGFVRERADQVRWFGPGEAVQIGGWCIPGGMIYVGTRFQPAASAYGCQQEPSMIDPTLAVAPPGSRSKAQLPYWPQYAQISPESRAALLEWQAGGRVDPGVQLGIVFLFLYGLERRLLIDGILEGDPHVRDEAPALVAELERLAEIYGSSHSFQRYSAQLILFARLALMDGEIRSPLKLLPESSIPDPRARVLLGEHSLEGRPLPWRLALYWYLSSEQKRLRTPAYRCWEHLVRLFERRYGEHFGEGMIVPPNRSRLRLTYTPASPGLGGLGASMQLPIGELPDLMRLRRPVDTLGVLVESCMQELDAYSRWVGREGNEPGSLEAVALLPAALVGEAQSRECDAIRAELEPLLRATEPSARAMAALDASTLFRHWKTAKEGLMSKREASTLMALLARLGFGIEPDPRFGGARIRADMQLVLFRQAPNAITSAPSSEYASARLVLQIAALVANADGSTEASEQLALERHLEDSLDLSAGEKLRLAAHLRWLQSSGAKLTGLKKQLAGLDANTREAIASFAVTIANADGRIDPKEVALLRRVYAMLELDPEEVYEAVHRATIAPALAPVAVRAAGPRRLGHRIPAPAPDASGRRPEAEAGAASAPVIDRAKVQKKIQETARVSALLAGIFDSEQEPEGADLEEEAPPQTLTPNAGGAAAIDRPPPAESGVAGLEPEQEAFLRALEARNQWEREAIEALAEAHGVLLEGTLDAINDLSFERIDEPAIEWDEPLEINRRALRELLG